MHLFSWFHLKYKYIYQYASNYNDDLLVISMNLFKDIFRIILLNMDRLVDIYLYLTPININSFLLFLFYVKNNFTKKRVTINKWKVKD